MNTVTEVSQLWDSVSKEHILLAINTQIMFHQLLKSFYKGINKITVLLKVILQELQIAKAIGKFNPKVFKKLKLK